MMKIAVIDKAPSRTKYSEYFEFEFDHYHMSSVPINKLLKKDVDLVVDLTEYDLVVLVGSEAAKEYAKVTSVTNLMGVLVHDKFVCISNPSVLIFKPEGKPDFQRALSKINALAKGEGQKVIRGDFKGINDPEEATEFLLEVLNNAVDIVAMDTEGTALYPRDGYVLGISVTYKPEHGRYILTDILTDEHFALLQQIIDRFTIVFHNLKYDVKMLEYHTPLRFDRKRTEDTMVMHYVLDENASHSLKSLALKYTDYGDYDSELEDFKKSYCSQQGILQDDFTYDLIPFDIICVYASIDTAVTYTVYKKFKPILDNNTNLKTLYYDIMLPATFFLNKMENVGIPMSKRKLKSAEGYLDLEIEVARKEINAIPEVKVFEETEGIIFNPNSVQQLRKILFDYLGLTPTGKLTATGAISTNAEVLDELSDEHGLPAAILKVRRLTKIKNTYISKILPELDRDSRIRTNFNLIFTTSGRLSSSGKFNAQQIPRDDPIIKGCIEAPAGYSIVSQDLQTGEMYYAAVLSGDKNLQEVFKSGGDFHSSIAKMVFELPCAVEDVKKLYPEMRQSAKAIN